MGDFIGTGDLVPFATIAATKAEAMIVDAEAMAKLVAPCITRPGFEHADAVKAILRAAILRWADMGSGAITAQSAGPFGQTIDTSKPRKSLFWPSEIEQLQGMCTPSGHGNAYSVDTVPATGAALHADTCSLTFGALYCSCGATLTGGLPLYGGDDD